MLRTARALFPAVIFLILASWPAFAVNNSECLMCHSAKGMAKVGKDGKPVSLYIDESVFHSSVHKDKKCIDCHTDLAGSSFPHKSPVAPVQCSKCHHEGNNDGAPNTSPMDDYNDSVHGQATAKGDIEAPRCKDCHGEHDIRSHNDPESRTYRANIPKTCARCHSDSKVVRDHNLPNNQPIKLYENSIHGRAVREQGLLSAAVCTDCHGFHNIKAPTDTDSKVNRPNIPETCGKCHKKVYEDYKQSVHGMARARGVKDAPVCTDCHGEHTIQPASSPASSVYPTHVVATCSKCHENARIQKAYGLPADRLSTYIGSFHGVANKYGETTVANCATCHGAHNILPSKDPRSSVNHKNLPATCGKCHPGAGTNFANGTVHLDPTPKRDRNLFWVSAFYSLFVFGMIASFAAYIGLDIFSRWRRGNRHGR